MNNHCEKLIESVKTLNKKITLDSLLDLCDDYDLTPAEVDWVTNQLSNFITDNDDGQNTENSNSIQHEAYVDLTDYSSAQTLNVDGLIELPDYYLSKDSGIVNVRIPDGVKSIGDYCFSDCPNLDTVVFPKSMMEIKNRAFLSCPKLRRFIFLGDLPDSLVVTPNIIIIHGDCEKSRYFKTQNESIIVMTRKSVRDWPHEVSNFAVVRGFIYSLRCNVDMLSRVIKDNTTYIQRHFEQLFYYAIVMHDRLILDYLYCQRLYPKKIHLDTFDILLYDDSIQKLRNLAQIESVYSNVHSGDIYSVKKEWAFKVVSKKEITTVQFKGTAIDCIQIPSSINGYPVTCIGANTFSPQQWGRRSVPEEFVLRRLIKRVILPDSIKKIDANAFDHCEYVTIYIPKSVENIDPLALGVSTMHNRYRLIVQKDSYAEQFAIVNDIPYFYDYPEYDRMVTFAITGSTKKGEESLFQNGLEITLTKESNVKFGNPIIYVSAEGYGRIGKVVSPLDAGNLFARTLCEKFFCIGTNCLNSIIDSRMPAKIIEAYSDFAVYALTKK